MGFFNAENASALLGKVSRRGFHVQYQLEKFGNDLTRSFWNKVLDRHTDTVIAIP